MRNENIKPEEKQKKKRITKKYKKKNARSIQHIFQPIKR